MEEIIGSKQAGDSFETSFIQDSIIENKEKQKESALKEESVDEELVIMILTVLPLILSTAG